ncbi:DUF4271 domain-containing protein [Paucihalobacter ruber]|uniref:DUF4271 domain-containing protein n=1 Tax=Paucihalobacter ruber TaxID=2567861 RepID=A0A506PQY9_9FLAO|nr:DUF4271 domain-containing protein [Paucihalobacter ruber]TPV34630.1 DUF4271 domain-containing protein [Paucihalobacter ruber]
MLREIVSNDWFTIGLVIALIAVSIVKLLYTRRFEDFLPVLVNSKYLKIYTRDQKFIDSFDSLLFTVYILMTGIFVYISFNALTQSNIVDPVILVKLIFAIAAFVLIKVLIERLIGSLFEIDQLIDHYLFQKTAYKHLTGLLLIPLNLFFIYVFEPSKVAILIVIIAIIGINIAGFITSFKTFQKLLISNFFYFILYLCALEIGPYIILYHLIKSYEL